VESGTGQARLADDRAERLWRNIVVRAVEGHGNEPASATDPALILRVAPVLAQQLEAVIAQDPNDVAVLQRRPAPRRQGVSSASSSTTLERAVIHVKGVRCQLARRRHHGVDKRGRGEPVAAGSLGLRLRTARLGTSAPAIRNSLL
jgi:hypothetical protein